MSDEEPSSPAEKPEFGAGLPSPIIPRRTLLGSIKSHFRMVKQMIPRGAVKVDDDGEITDEDVNLGLPTLLYIMSADSDAQDRIIRSLHATGLDLNFVLFEAAEKGNFDIMKKLIRAGASPKFVRPRDPEKDTVMHILARRSNSTAMLTWLFQRNGKKKRKRDPTLRPGPAPDPRLKNVRGECVIEMIGDHLGADDEEQEGEDGRNGGGNELQILVGVLEKAAEGWDRRRERRRLKQQSKAESASSPDEQFGRVRQSKKVHKGDSIEDEQTGGDGASGGSNVDAAEEIRRRMAEDPTYVPEEGQEEQWEELFGHSYSVSVSRSGTKKDPYHQRETTFELISDGLSEEDRAAVLHQASKDDVPLASGHLYKMADDQRDQLAELRKMEQDFGLMASSVTAESLLDPQKDAEMMQALHKKSLKAKERRTSSPSDDDDAQ